MNKDDIKDLKELTVYIDDKIDLVIERITRAESLIDGISTVLENMSRFVKEISEWIKEIDEYAGKATGFIRGDDPSLKSTPDMMRLPYANYETEKSWKVFHPNNSKLYSWIPKSQGQREGDIIIPPEWKAKELQNESKWTLDTYGG